MIQQEIDEIRNEIKACKKADNFCDEFRIEELHIVLANLLAEQELKDEVLFELQYY